MGMTKSEFMTRYINEKYDKIREKKQKEQTAQSFVSDRAYAMNKRMQRSK